MRSTWKGLPTPWPQAGLGGASPAPTRHCPRAFQMSVHSPALQQCRGPNPADRETEAQREGTYPQGMAGKFWSPDSKSAPAGRLDPQPRPQLSLRLWGAHAVAGGERSPRCRERLRPGLWPLSVSGWFQVCLGPPQLPRLPGRAAECGRCTIPATAKTVTCRSPRVTYPGAVASVYQC